MIPFLYFFFVLALFCCCCSHSSSLPFSLSFISFDWYQSKCLQLYKIVYQNIHTVVMLFRREREEGAGREQIRKSTKLLNRFTKHQTHEEKLNRKKEGKRNRRLWRRFRVYCYESLARDIFVQFAPGVVEYERRGEKQQQKKNWTITLSQQLLVEHARKTSSEWNFWQRSIKEACWVLMVFDLLYCDE